MEAEEEEGEEEGEKGEAVVAVKTSAEGEQMAGIKEV